MSVIPVQRLIAAARRAARRSHSPYSRFPVGAALLTSAGAIVTGCNVENASYGLTLCAERAAVARAVAQGHRQFRALAVAAGRGPAPAYPCGACRQVLAEFCAPGLVVVLAPLDAGGRAVRTTLGRLLPKAFALRPRGPRP
jgi:cytidine deaminase